MDLDKLAIFKFETQNEQRAAPLAIIGMSVHAIHVRPANPNFFVRPWTIGLS